MQVADSDAHVVNQRGWNAQSQSNAQHGVSEAEREKAAIAAEHFTEEESTKESGDREYGIRDVGRRKE